MTRKIKILGESTDSDRCPSERGAVIVEFAFGFALVLFCVLGLAEFGRLAWTNHTLTFAVQEAGRVAIVRGSDSGRPVSAAYVQALVEEKSAWLDSNRLTVLTTWDPDNASGSTVTVQATYNFMPVGVQLFSLNGIQLTGQTRMTIQK